MKLLVMNELKGYIKRSFADCVNYIVRLLTTDFMDLWTFKTIFIYQP